MNGRFDLQPVADDAGILHQFFFFLISIPGNFINIKIIKGFKEIIFLFQDRFPTQSCLVYFQHQSCKQKIIIINGKPIFIVMIMPVNSVFPAFRTNSQ